MNLLLPSVCLVVWVTSPPAVSARVVELHTSSPASCFLSVSVSQCQGSCQRLHPTGEESVAEAEAGFFFFPHLRDERMSSHRVPAVAEVLRAGRETLTLGFCNLSGLVHSTRGC